MTPQFTYDSEGKPVGVFLPIEDWNQLRKELPEFGKLFKFSPTDDSDKSKPDIENKELDII